MIFDYLVELIITKTKKAVSQAAFFDELKTQLVLHLKYFFILIAEPNLSMCKILAHTYIVLFFGQSPKAEYLKFSPGVLDSSQDPVQFVNL